jgi:XRE family aerobic/anaerobic benzoate catabolism transcriptional regulator
VELADEIQKNAGLDLAEIFELHGPDYYRSLVRGALDQRLSDSGQAIIALPGGIVTDQQAWGLVRRCFSTVWLHAKAIDLLERVANQGDHRPMDASEDAMSDLERMMASREPGYRQAEIQIDTSSAALDQLEELLASSLAEIGWEGSQAGFVP